MTSNDWQLLYLCIGICYGTFVSYEIFRTIYKPDTEFRRAARARLDDALGRLPFSDKAIFTFIILYQTVSWMLMVLFWPVNIVLRLRDGSIKIWREK